MTGAPRRAAAEHDVVVVGSGATGGWAAKELTEAGLDVLVLEAGEWPSRAGAVGPHTWSRGAALRAGMEERARERQPTQSLHGAWHRYSADLFVDDRDHPYGGSDQFVWIRSRQVGGRSLLWGALALRVSDHELAAARADGHGIDWPLAYADLAPYYDRVERFLGVLGTREGSPTLPDGVYAGERLLTPAERDFRNAVAARWPDRRVIPARGIPRPSPAEAGSGWPRFSSPGSTLIAAERTGRMTLATGAVVAGLDVDRSRRGVDVRYVDAPTGEARTVRARAVVLCASTIESTRILLSSRVRGGAAIGAASGALGSYLMDHPAVGMEATIERDDADTAERLFFGPDGIYVPRFRNVTARDPRFVRGYGIWGSVGRARSSLDRPPRGRVTLRLVACGEMLARAENRVELDAHATDRHGLPVPRIRCAWGANERAMMEDAAAVLRELAEAAGARDVRVSPITTPGKFVHEVGTARMGADPRTSVLDPLHACWEAPEVIVTDGACWPTSAYQNPTLTMMALTVRACEHLAGRLRRA